jgi:hypothetical protein
MLAQRTLNRIILLEVLGGVAIYGSMLTVVFHSLQYNRPAEMYCLR